MKKILIIVLCSVSVLLRAADVVPAANRPPAGWVPGVSVGVQGGIPNWSTVSATLTSSATSSEIENACNAAADNTVVVVEAGTYNLSGDINITNNRVVLRGEVDAYGVPTTIFDFGANGSGWGLIDVSKDGYPANSWDVTVRDVSSGLERGSEQVTLATAPTGLAVGQWLYFDAPADEDLVRSTTTDEGVGTWERPTGRSYQQIVMVTDISGSVVDFTPAIYGDYWGTLGSNQAYYYYSGADTSTVNWVGIENINISRNTGSGGINNIHVGPAANCWVKNVWSTQCNTAHIRTGWTIFCEIRDCYTSTHDSVASATYSLYSTYSGSLLAENNIFYNTPCAVGLLATTGSVIGHNVGELFPYFTSTWLPETIMQHAAHCNFNLWEGNHVPSFWADLTHGNSSYTLIVGNRLAGWDTGKTSSTTSIAMHEQQDYMVVAGNIFGTQGYHATYASLFNVDADAQSTWIRIGNSNTVDDGIPAGESIGADTISASYYLTETLEHAGVLGAEPYFSSAVDVPDTVTMGEIPAGFRFQDENNAWPAAASGPTGTTINVGTLLIGASP